MARSRLSRSREAARGVSLEKAFDPTANALAMIRLALAGTVAVVHATQLGFGWQPVLGGTLVGDLAVSGFFVVSGFLVTRSYLRLDSVWRYAWHRFLRIMPGFWVCLALTAVVVAPLIAVQSGRSAASVFSGEASSWQYIGNNFLLLMRQYDIQGLPTQGYEPAVLDGSLWTLFYEGICYAAVAALGVLGLLKSRRGLVLACSIAIWGLVVVSSNGVEVPGSDYLLPLACAFFLGAAGYLFAERVPISNAAALVATAVFLLMTWAIPDQSALGLPAFAYLCLWAMVTLPWRQNPSRDLSYGLYIYHWPVHQVLIMAGAASLGVAGFVILSLLVVSVVAVASWHVVEEPALRFKDSDLRRFFSPRAHS